MHASETAWQHSSVHCPKPMFGPVCLPTMRLLPVTCHAAPRPSHPLVEKFERISPQIFLTHPHPPPRHRRLTPTRLPPPATARQSRVNNLLSYLVLHQLFSSPWDNATPRLLIISRSLEFRPPRTTYISPKLSLSLPLAPLLFFPT
jgi:hypothetical protein